MDSINLSADFIDEATAPFLGRWNRLVSTTNWEKGRIIHDWREALIASDAPAADYSDEAWSRRVGSVSSQHVGRLRRVYDRFGGVHDDYTALYWSHFQAAIDWNDAEMWLEGAVQNRWSVAAMRRERWQAFGGTEDDRPLDEDVIAGELDEDADSPNLDRLSPPANVLDASSGEAGNSSRSGDASNGPLYSDPDFGDVPSSAGDHGRDRSETAISEDDTDEKRLQPTPVQPFANLPPLPDDLSEAFESFKLAILRHKTSGWQEVACGDVLRSLDALKVLATASP
jgi:hypothetical protein